MTLMRSQLRTHTRRIRYDDAETRRALASLQPGQATAEAVERGCLLMLRGSFVSSTPWRASCSVRIVKYS